MFKELCLVLMVASLMTGCAMLRHEPINHFNDGDYRQAANSLPSLAASGDAEAETDLGYMYQYGIDVPKDESHALDLFKQAAMQGYAPGETALGVLLVQGDTIPHDYAQALTLFESAMNKDYLHARENLGRMYYEGWGVPKDPVKGESIADDSVYRLDPDLNRYNFMMRNAVIMHMYYFSGSFKEYNQPALASFSVVNGKGTDIKIERSSGSSIIDADLTEAISKTTFPPPPLGTLIPSIFKVEARQ